MKTKFKTLFTRRGKNSKEGGLIWNKQAFETLSCQYLSCLKVKPIVELDKVHST